MKTIESFNAEKKQMLENIKESSLHCDNENSSVARYLFNDYFDFNDFDRYEINNYDSHNYIEISKELDSILYSILHDYFISDGYTIKSKNIYICIIYDNNDNRIYMYFFNTKKDYLKEISNSKKLQKEYMRDDHE